jgi:hypothetical protein
LIRRRSMGRSADAYCQFDRVTLQESPLGVPHEMLKASDRWVHDSLANRFPIGEMQSLSERGELEYWGAFATRCDFETPTDKIDLFDVHVETLREGMESLLHGGWKGRRDVDNETI